MKKIVVLLFLFSVSVSPQAILTENNWSLLTMPAAWCDSANTYSKIMEYPDNEEEHFQMFQNSGGTDTWLPGHSGYGGDYYVVGTWHKYMTYPLPDTIYAKFKVNNFLPSVLSVWIDITLQDSLTQSFVTYGYEVPLDSDWKELKWDTFFAQPDIDHFVVFSFNFYLIALDSSYLSAGIQVDSLRGKYSDGSIVMFDNFGDPITGINPSEIKQNPTDFILEQNYPNPFNPSTKISWYSSAGIWQTLKIYDVIGNEVATLVNEYKPAGSCEVEFNASNIPSGVYFYKLQTDSFVETKKMILLK